MKQRMSLAAIGALVCLPSLAPAQNSNVGSKGTSVGPRGPAPTTVDVINFDRQLTGTILDTVFGRRGTGPISVQGVNPALPGQNAAVIFNSSVPTGEDPDLGSPNQDFGGPGIGVAGQSGSPFQNDRALRKILIVGEDLVDANNDGRVDDPDDADLVGSALWIDFLDVSPVTIFSIDLLDVESDRMAAEVEFFDQVGASLGTVALPVVGDNGLATVDLGAVTRVKSMHVRLNGSGAIDNVLFARENAGRIGDFVWCDLDNDGVQDAGEPGIPGVTVNLRCAGPDGILGNADDLLDSQVTNANGMYLFTQLPPGICEVEVDTSTAPDGKVPGDNCPTSYTVDLAPAGRFLAADFCFINPGEIGDFVWCDLDLDGEQDPGEPGIEGAVVHLTCAGPDGTLGTADDYTDTAMTDANGLYLFTNVPPGLCEISVDPASVDDKVPGDDCPTTVVKALAPAQSCLDVDFCFHLPPGEIGDTVYCDLNRDGVQDPGEPGIGGVIVNLTCAGIDGMLGTADDITDSAVTDANGNYLFTDVPAGICEVEVDLNSGPPDKLPGQCPPVVLVDLQPAQSFLDADFCFEFPEPGQIGDFVWCDLDNDGMQDPGEPGIAGVVVYLTCAGPDGNIGTPDDYTDTAVTDANGNYLFTDIPPDECRVAVDVTTAGDKVPGDNCPVLDGVDLQPGQSYLDADFCFVFPPGEIGDTVYCDLDNDGSQDAGEPGIPGAIVNLQCAGPDGTLGTGDDIVDSQVTDANGNYLFTDVPAGLCEVSVDVDTVGDKIPGECPLDFVVDLMPGESFLDADFCFVTPGEIGDTVFCDLDSDGVQDPGEPGIEGVVIALVCAGDDDVIGTADDLTDSAATDANGNYLFTDLPPGLCQVSVDVTTAPPPKVPGVCPTEVTVALAPGQSFLDADFCFEFPPPSDCCEHGKPRALTFLYTGEDCSATTHSQDPGKVSCSGNPGFASPVHIRGTDKENPFDTGGQIWFEADVNLDQAYTLDATNEGEDKLTNTTFIHIFDLADNLLQTVEFHTSCSQPLGTLDQFGANLLIDCEGEDEPIEGDCCAHGKPRELTFTYTGEDCSATTHAQDPSKVSCTGDPAFAATVHIRGSDDSDPDDTGARIWFEGDVALGENFTLDAAAEEENRLPSETFIHIFDLADNLLQTVRFHTSCSQPLFEGNQFGASLLVGCVGEDEPGSGGSADSCDDGKPQVLIMRYTGEDCGATSHSQDPGKVSCDGDPMFATMVFIRSSDKENPDDTGGNNWFEGNVALDSQFDIDATRAEENRLKSATFVHVFDLDDNLLQTIEFHTSCSQPLSIGDQFGSVVLEVFIPE